MTTRNKTSRGFAIYGHVKDSMGQHIRVQESSAINHSPRAWLFCDLDGNGTQKPHHLGQCNPCCPYLTKAQAKRLAKALLKFAEASK